MSIKSSSKAIFKKLLNPIIAVKPIWPFFLFFVKLGEYFRYQKSLFDNAEAIDELKLFFSGLKVRTGYFKGLQYPSFTSSGSSLFPKLLGSYEYELFPFFNAISDISYLNIIDIGCAEGYYAVGLAMKYNTAQVFAYDLNESALVICRDMALANNVGERIFTGNYCNSDVLRKIDLSKRTLIVCDCEGFERSLFQKVDALMYKGCDILIELHHFNDQMIKEYLADIFNHSHAITYQASFNDDRKLFDYQDNLSGLSKVAKLKAIQEGRIFTMEWMILMSNIYLQQSVN